MCRTLSMRRDRRHCHEYCVNPCKDWKLMLVGVALYALLTTTVEGQSSASTAPGCGAAVTAQEILSDASHLGHGLTIAPRNALRPHNLKWELPIAAATGVLIAAVDQPAINRIHSVSLQNQASRWSNIGVGMELGAAGLAWGIGCAEHNSAMRDTGTGLTALAAAGAAAGMAEVMKIGINRQYPYAINSKGEFWEGGKSFPSGHSAASFAVAAVVAHRYPKKRWVKWGAYAFASAVTLSRFPAKKHFPSDMLVGATIGYVTGTYLAAH